MSSPPAPSHKQLENQWDEFSSYFQKYFERCTNITGQTLLSMIKIGSEEEQTIVEAGCGAGGALHLARAQMGPKTSITAVDLSPNMIQLAKARAKSLPMPDKKEVTFIQGSIDSLPMEDGSVDKIYSNYVIHLVPDPDAALKELRRILKPNGLLAFSVWGRPSHSPKFTIMGPIVSRLMKEWGMEESPAMRSAFHLSDEKKVKEMIAKAGFSKSMTWYQKEVFEISAEEYANAIMYGSPTYRKLCGQLTEEQLRTFEREIISAANSVLSSGEPIQNEVLIAVATA